MKILVTLLFLAAMTAVKAGSEIQDHSAYNGSQQGSNVEKNSAGHDGSIKTEQNSMKPRNPPRHMQIMQPTHSQSVSNISTLGNSYLRTPILSNRSEQKNNESQVIHSENDNNISMKSKNKTVRTELASTVKIVNVTEKTNANSVPMKTEVFSQISSESNASNSTQSKKTSRNIKIRATVFGKKPKLDIKVEQKIIDTNGKDVFLKFHASQQKDSKPEVTLGIEGTKNGNGLGAEVKIVEEISGWSVTGKKKNSIKNDKDVILTTKVSQQKTNKFDTFFCIESTKNSSNIGVEMNFVDGKPKFSINGKNTYYNKNDISITMNVGASLKNFNETEKFVNIKARKNGLSASLNIVDYKLEWELIGESKIYHKNGVSVTLITGVIQKKGDNPKGIIEFEVFIQQ